MLASSARRRGIRAPFLEHQKAWLISLRDIIPLPDPIQLLQIMHNNYDSIIVDLFSKGIPIVDFFVE
jgi:hypothetical protein